jgi:hypothetical protein
MDYRSITFEAEKSFSVLYSIESADFVKKDTYFIWVGFHVENSVNK